MSFVGCVALRLAPPASDLKRPIGDSANQVQGGQERPGFGDGTLAESPISADQEPRSAFIPVQFAPSLAERRNKLSDDPLALAEILTAS